MTNDIFEIFEKGQKALQPYGKLSEVGMEAVESLDDIDEDDVPDILLDQAAGIVTDLATMRQVDFVEPTAQLRPAD